MRQSIDPPTESPAFFASKLALPFFWRFPRVGIGWGRIQFARVMAFFRYRVTEYRGYVPHRWRFELYRKERILFATAPAATRAMVSLAEDRPPPSWLRKPYFV